MKRLLLYFTWLACLLPSVASTAWAQLGTVKSFQKISDTQGGFNGVLHDREYFGFSVTSLGDLDGDTVPELAVGAQLDDDGGENRGAVWVLFLNNNGTVKSAQKISDTQGGFTGVLDNGDSFGTSVANLGDLDGDGIPEMAVGAGGDEDGGSASCEGSTIGYCPRGAVWVLFMNKFGLVKSHQKISQTQGFFFGDLDDYDGFGQSVTNLGDLDGNGIPDLAVGANGDDDGGSGWLADHGAVWELFLDPGCVKDENLMINQKCNESSHEVNPQWVLVTCAIIDCCPFCPLKTIVDLVIRVQGDPYISVLLYFENLTDEAAREVKIEGNARWMAAARRLEILGKGTVTVRGLRVDPNSPLSAAVSPRMTVVRVLVANPTLRSGKMAPKRTKRYGIVDLMVDKLVKGHKLETATRTYRYWY